MPEAADDYARRIPRGRDRRHLERRKTDHHRGVNWSALGVLIALAIALLTALISLTSRVTTLETQSRNDSARMERIERSTERTESTVTRILERVK